MKTTTGSSPSSTVSLCLESDTDVMHASAITTRPRPKIATTAPRSSTTSFCASEWRPTRQPARRRWIRRSVLSRARRTRYRAHLPRHLKGTFLLARPAVPASSMRRFSRRASGLPTRPASAGGFVLPPSAVFGGTAASQHEGHAPVDGAIPRRRRPGDVQRPRAPSSTRR